MIAGSRSLPTHHVTIRVPWHDDGWRGTVCRKPGDNTHCLILPRIGKSKREQAERQCAGQNLHELDENQRPPCVGERVSFMSPFEVPKRVLHPYVGWSEHHAHLEETPFSYAAYSAACVPFRWMLRENVEGNAEKRIRGIRNELQLGYQPEREPMLRDRKSKREVTTSWVQERDNQLVLLDTFFGALRPQESLCFFYAKRTPLAEDPRRVIVGVGRVASVGRPTEYAFSVKDPPLRSVLWERNVAHTIRPKFEDGFLFPYQELLELADRDPSFPLAKCVAFAPNDLFERYSYGSELLPQDGAIASLLTCHAVMERISELVPGPWRTVLSWIDDQLGALWRARGPFPGLGALLSAFGLERGNLIAYEIDALWAARPDRMRESPWKLIDEVFAHPERLPSGLGASIGETFKKKWHGLPADRRALLELLSRSALSEDQATRFYQETERAAAGVTATDQQILANPYIVYERDRQNLAPVAVDVLDRGLFPDPAIRDAFPVPAPSALSDAIDARRVRALVIDTLECAADEGHTILPRRWVVQRIRERALEPACPLDEDTLRVTQDVFAPLVLDTPLGGDRRGLQLDRYAETKRIIANELTKRVNAPRHGRKYDWAEIVARGLNAELPTDATEREVEVRARAEKAAALEELFASRASVLVGPAGTGKTTLLRMLCGLDPVASGGVLLLAPTGKARVRLEEQTQLRGSGRTIAQFLNGLNRYDGTTGRYYPNQRANRSAAHRTVVIDECSMLTEEQLAAVLDALENVERLVLVGDPQQLPPIGAGRPFVDIVTKLAPEDLERRFPRCARGYAELTVPSRQRGPHRDDVLLAAHFSGRPLDPAADEVWSRIARHDAHGVRALQWHDSGELVEMLMSELRRVLPPGETDEIRFELSIGGTVSEAGHMGFWRGRGDDGAARSAHRWQILSPVRGTLHGVDALNREVQSRFRTRVRELALAPKWNRLVPAPLGPQTILWGDKVINIVNSGRRKTFPKLKDAYVANGDIGIVVGEFKRRNFPGVPENLEVEFASQPTFHFTFWANEMGSEEKSPPLELAYALTVHKTQGSEFGVTFVVLPNPCRLLSRELLYTALTRQQNEIILLHQGPIGDLRKYAEDGASEIAMRMTNLFEGAAPREVPTQFGVRFLDDRLIHRTERGDLVRSKSEVVIADKLFARGVRYLYEESVMLAGIERWPDFTIADASTGVTYYWEHLGMLHDPAYAARWERKLGEYRRAGIAPLEEGGGTAGILIMTRDEPNGGIDSARIARIVQEVLVQGHRHMPP